MTGLAGYPAFLASKRRAFAGFGLQPESMPSALFDWQVAIVRWVLRKGRAAIFADCGLGKTFMQIAWALNIPGRGQGRIWAVLRKVSLFDRRGAL